MRHHTKNLRRRAIFLRTTPRGNMDSSSSVATSTSSSSKHRFVRSSEESPSAGSDDIEEVIMTPGVATGRVQPAVSVAIPDLFTQLPPVKDDLATSTSKTQDETVAICLPYLAGGDANADVEHNNHGVPHIDRKKHVRFLRNMLKQLPAPFIAADASRPWFLYWSLNAMAILGEDVKEDYAESLADTARSMQNEYGGFSGGHGQTSHLATTYAVVLALAIVGDEEGLSFIDRKALWKWLCDLKEADGGFRMSLGGEEDVRGAYCAAVIISLLNLPLDLCKDSEAYIRDPNANLFTGLGDYVRKCQTFEGGISGQPDAEAHGAYAFCALGCLSLLGTPSETIPKYLNVERLISWLSSRQYAPEGGFSGRTNKLVDGCYSHWVGGCWPLIEACLNGPVKVSNLDLEPQPLFSREGLMRYILCCCQEQGKRGGLRDKPGKPSDAYHSCYVLSGLSSAQNRWQLVVGDDDMPAWMVSPFPNEEEIFDEKDRVGTVHPVYVIPEDKVAKVQTLFASRDGF
ncbi:uncharacterized protein PgNI_04205 [Pyricularia grisea]|uniref:Protein farnesyltransferase subunit beta n=1 Tax=Pyricularia grisea TaxID=148305 RepID=A0A6P8BFG0_PYRGI|nr:uncharacterized protein PgNI_04205 [Pyricularia grisea]TLD14434.1 hypothetical protein PgNI_04205 [Pyricularia grisea]